MELALTIKKIHLMEDFMGKKEEVINEYLQGKRSLVNTIDDVCDLLQEDI